MDITLPLALLGGLSPTAFMQTYWEKQPLLVRAALPGMTPLLGRAELLALAASDAIESRLVSRSGQAGASDWVFKRGPFARRALPAFRQSHWTLLLQGMDLQHPGVHALLQRFRFVPDARLDDVMISYATDGGGVGPHFDHYDVFLLQVQGQRRWRYGRQSDQTLVAGLPLKILAHFEPEFDEVLNPGDMLYLPPHWAHDGVALGECMTYSVGFRAPGRAELAAQLLTRLADAADDWAGAAVYRDPEQGALTTPASIPVALQGFARAAVLAGLSDPALLDGLLGEYLTEPKDLVWFEAAADADLLPGALTLDRRTRMLYDARHIFINGESHQASGADAALMRALADARTLGAADCAGASAAARDLLRQWLQAGWLHATA